MGWRQSSLGNIENAIVQMKVEYIETTTKTRHGSRVMLLTAPGVKLLSFYSAAHISNAVTSLHNLRGLCYITVVYQLFPSPEYSIRKLTSGE